MDEKQRLGVRAFARLIGVKHFAVQKAIATGRLKNSVTYNSKGWPLIDPDLAGAEWRANTDPALQRKEPDLPPALPSASSVPVAAPSPPAVQLDQLVSDNEDVESENAAPATTAPIQKGEKPAVFGAPQARAAAGQDEDGPGVDEVHSGTGTPKYTESRAKRELYKARLAELEYQEKSGQMVPVESVRKDAFETARTVRNAILNIPERLASLLAAESDAHAVHQTLVKELNLALQALAHAEHRG